MRHLWLLLVLPLCVTAQTMSRSPAFLGNAAAPAGCTTTNAEYGAPQASTINAFASVDRTYYAGYYTNVAPQNCCAVVFKMQVNSGVNIPSMDAKLHIWANQVVDATNTVGAEVFAGTGFYDLSYITNAASTDLYIPLGSTILITNGMWIGLEADGVSASTYVKQITGKIGSRILGSENGSAWTSSLSTRHISLQIIGP